MSAEAANEEIVFIRGRSLVLRPFLERDFSEAYMAWLNDPEVNAYSQRRPFPVNWSGMRSHFEHHNAHPDKGYLLAMLAGEERRLIGSVALVNHQPVHRCAELAILIGDRSAWGRGYGTEALYLLAKHAFLYLNLHKVFAGTFNPSFIRCCEKLGWTKEGVFRERIWSNGRFHDQTWLSILAQDFRDDPRYEPRPESRAG